MIILPSKEYNNPNNEKITTYQFLSNVGCPVFDSVLFDENEPIGICTITFNSDDGCVFSQGFLAEYRGKGYAKLVRNVVSEALFNQGVKVIKAYIKKRNVSSIKSVSKTNGFLEEVPGTDLLEIRYTQDRKR